MLYSHYFHRDTFLYFNSGVRLADLARQDPSLYLQFLWGGNDSFSLSSGLMDSEQPRVLFMVKITSLFNLLTHDNYWITSLYFSFVSFAFAWKLVSVISEVMPNVRVPAVVSFLFLPSAVFWSSGVIKESLAMAVLFFLSSLVVKAWSRRSLRICEWITIPFSLWLVWSLKYYYLAVFFPVVVFSIVAQLYFTATGTRTTFQKSLLPGDFCTLSRLFFIPNFDPGLF